MQTVKIYDTESPRDIAEKIYKHFEVGASCSVFGFMQDEERLVPRGDVVLEFIRLFDEIDNIKYRGIKKERKYIFRKESIGGPILHKIFTWEIRVVEKEVRYTIWRLQ